MRHVLHMPWFYITVTHQSTKSVLYINLNQPLTQPPSYETFLDWNMTNSRWSLRKLPSVNDGCIAVQLVHAALNIINCNDMNWNKFLDCNYFQCFSDFIFKFPPPDASASLASSCICKTISYYQMWTSVSQYNTDYVGYTQLTFSSLTNTYTYTQAIKTCRIASLYHKVFNISVEQTVVIVAAGTQGKEILHKQQNSLLDRQIDKINYMRDRYTCRLVVDPESINGTIPSCLSLWIACLLLRLSIHLLVCVTHHYCGEALYA